MAEGANNDFLIAVTVSNIKDLDNLLSKLNELQTISQSKVELPVTVDPSSLARQEAQRTTGGATGDQSTARTPTYPPRVAVGTGAGTSSGLEDAVAGLRETVDKYLMPAARTLNSAAQDLRKQTDPNDNRQKRKRKGETITDPKDLPGAVSRAEGRSSSAPVDVEIAPVHLNMDSFVGAFDKVADAIAQRVEGVFNRLPQILDPQTLFETHQQYRQAQQYNVGRPVRNVQDLVDRLRDPSTQRGERDYLYTVLREFISTTGLSKERSDAAQQALAARKARITQRAPELDVESKDQRIDLARNNLVGIAAGTTGRRLGLSANDLRALQERVIAGLREQAGKLIQKSTQEEDELPRQRQANIDKRFAEIQQTIDIVRSPGYQVPTRGGKLRAATDKDRAKKLRELTKQIEAVQEEQDALDLDVLPTARGGTGWLENQQRSARQKREEAGRVTKRADFLDRQVAQYGTAFDGILPADVIRTARSRFNEMGKILDDYIAALADPAKAAKLDPKIVSEKLTKIAQSNVLTARLVGGPVGEQDRQAIAQAQRDLAVATAEHAKFTADLERVQGAPQSAADQAALAEVRAKLEAANRQRATLARDYALLQRAPAKSVNPQDLTDKKAALDALTVERDQLRADYDRRVAATRSPFQVAQQRADDARNARIRRDQDVAAAAGPDPKFQQELIAAQNRVRENRTFLAGQLVALRARRRDLAAGKITEEQAGLPKLEEEITKSRERLARNVAKQATAQQAADTAPLRDVPQTLLARQAQAVRDEVEAQRAFEDLQQTITALKPQVEASAQSVAALTRALEHLQQTQTLGTRFDTLSAGEAGVMLDRIKDARAVLQPLADFATIYKPQVAPPAPKFSPLKDVFEETADATGNLTAVRYNEQNMRELQNALRAGYTFKPYGADQERILTNALAYKQSEHERALTEGRGEDAEKLRREQESLGNRLYMGGEWHFAGRDHRIPFTEYQSLKGLEQYPDARSFSRETLNGAADFLEQLGLLSQRGAAIFNRTGPQTPTDARNATSHVANVLGQAQSGAAQTADAQAFLQLMSQTGPGAEERILAFLKGYENFTPNAQGPVIVNEMAAALERLAKVVNGMPAKLARVTLEEQRLKLRAVGLTQDVETTRQKREIDTNAKNETRRVRGDEDRKTTTNRETEKRATSDTNKTNRLEIDNNRFAERERLLRLSNRLRRAGIGGEAQSIRERVQQFGILGGGGAPGVGPSGPPTRAIIAGLDKQLRTIATSQDRFRSAMVALEQNGGFRIGGPDVYAFARQAKRAGQVSDAATERYQDYLAQVERNPVLSEHFARLDQAATRRGERPLLGPNGLATQARQATNVRQNLFERGLELRNLIDRARTFDKNARAENPAEYNALRDQIRTKRQELGGLGLDKTVTYDANGKAQVTSQLENVDRRVVGLAHDEAVLTQAAASRGKAYLDALRPMKETTTAVDRFYNKLQMLATYMGAGFLIYGFVAKIRQLGREVVNLQSEMARVQGILESKSTGDRNRVERGVIGAALDYGQQLGPTVEVAKTFAQAGLPAGDTLRETRAALSGVEGAGLNPQQVIETLIAVRNLSTRPGQKEASVSPENILDRISKIEATNAVTANDLSVAIQRVGALAVQLQPDQIGRTDAFDTVIAATTQIVEKTRVTGNQAATSLRYVLSRLQAPEVAATLQNQYGIRLANNPEGTELRPLMDVLADIAATYKELKGTQRGAQLLATVGGNRQIVPTAALLDGFDDVLKTANRSAEAYGDTQRRLAIQQETVQFKLNQLNVATIDLANQFLKTSGILGIFGGAVSTATALIKYVAGRESGAEANAKQPGDGFTDYFNRQNLGTEVLGAVLGIATALGGRAATRKGAALKELARESIAFNTATAGPRTAPLRLATRVGPAVTGVAAEAAEGGGILLQMLGKLTFIGQVLTAISLTAGLIAAGWQAIRYLRGSNGAEANEYKRVDKDTIEASEFYKDFKASTGALGENPESVKSAVSDAIAEARSATTTRFNDPNLFNTDPALRTTQRGVRESFTQSFTDALARALPGLRNIKDENERQQTALKLLKDAETSLTYASGEYGAELKSRLDNLSSDLVSRLTAAGQGPVALNRREADFIGLGVPTGEKRPDSLGFNYAPAYAAARAERQSQSVDTQVTSDIPAILNRVLGADDFAQFRRFNPIIDGEGRNFVNELSRREATATKAFNAGDSTKASFTLGRALDELTRKTLILSKEQSDAIAAARDAIGATKEMANTSGQVLAELRSGRYQFGQSAADVLTNQNQLVTLLAQRLGAQATVDARARDLSQDNSYLAGQSPVGGDVFAQTMKDLLIQAGRQVQEQLRKAGLTPQAAAYGTVLDALGNPANGNAFLAQVQDKDKARPGRDLVLSALSRYRESRAETEALFANNQSAGLGFDAQTRRVQDSQQLLGDLSGVRAKLEGQLAQLLERQGTMQEFAANARKSLGLKPVTDEETSALQTEAAKHLTEAAANLDKTEEDKLNKQLGYVRAALKELEGSDLFDNLPKALKQSYRSAIDLNDPAALVTTFKQIVDAAAQIAAHEQEVLLIRQRNYDVIRQEADLQRQRADQTARAQQVQDEITQGRFEGEYGPTSTLALKSRGLTSRRQSQEITAGIDFTETSLNIEQQLADKKIGDKEAAKLLYDAKILELNKREAALVEERLERERLLNGALNDARRQLQESAHNTAVQSLAGLRGVLAGGYESFRGTTKDGGEKDGRAGISGSVLLKNIFEPFAATIQQRMADNLVSLLGEADPLENLFKSQLLAEDNLFRAHLELQRQAMREGSAEGAEKGVVAGLASVEAQRTTAAADFYAKVPNARNSGKDFLNEAANARPEKYGFPEGALDDPTVLRGARARDKNLVDRVTAADAFLANNRLATAGQGALRTAAAPENIALYADVLPLLEREYQKAGVKAVINSGYRSPEHNKFLQHQYDIGNGAAYGLVVRPADKSEHMDKDKYPLDISPDLPKNDPRRAQWQQIIAAINTKYGLYNTVEGDPVHFQRVGDVGKSRYGLNPSTQEQLDAFAYYGRVSPQMAWAYGQVESDLTYSAYNKKGNAYGMFQVQPATAAGYGIRGVEDLYRRNGEAGGKRLAEAYAQADQYNLSGEQRDAAARMFYSQRNDSVAAYLKAGNDPTESSEWKKIKAQLAKAPQLASLPEFTLSNAVTQAKDATVNTTTATINVGSLQGALGGGGGLVGGSSLFTDMLQNLPKRHFGGLLDNETLYKARKDELLLTPQHILNLTGQSGAAGAQALLSAATQTNTPTDPVDPVVALSQSIAAGLGFKPKPLGERGKELKRQYEQQQSDAASAETKRMADLFLHQQRQGSAAGRDQTALAAPVGFQPLPFATYAGRQAKDATGAGLDVLLGTTYGFTTQTLRMAGKLLENTAGMRGENAASRYGAGMAHAADVLDTRAQRHARSEFTTLGLATGQVAAPIAATVATAGTAAGVTAPTLLARAALQTALFAPLTLTNSTVGQGAHDVLKDLAFNVGTEGAGKAALAGLGFFGFLKKGKQAVSAEDALANLALVRHPDVEMRENANLSGVFDYYRAQLDAHAKEIMKRGSGSGSVPLPDRVLQAIIDNDPSAIAHHAITEAFDAPGADILETARKRVLDMQYNIMQGSKTFGRDEKAQWLFHNTLDAAHAHIGAVGAEVEHILPKTTSLEEFDNASGLTAHREAVARQAAEAERRAEETKRLRAHYAAEFKRHARRASQETRAGNSSGAEYFEKWGDVYKHRVRAIDAGVPVGQLTKETDYQTKLYSLYSSLHELENQGPSFYTKYNAKSVVEKSKQIAELEGRPFPESDRLRAALAQVIETKKAALEERAAQRAVEEAAEAREARRVAKRSRATERRRAKTQPRVEERAAIVQRYEAAQRLKALEEARRVAREAEIRTYVANLLVKERAQAAEFGEKYPLSAPRHQRRVAIAERLAALYGPNGGALPAGVESTRDVWTYFDAVTKLVEEQRYFARYAPQQHYTRSAIHSLHGILDARATLENFGGVPFNLAQLRGIDAPTTERLAGGLEAEVADWAKRLVDWHEGTSVAGVSERGIELNLDSSIEQLRDFNTALNRPGLRRGSVDPRLLSTLTTGTLGAGAGAYYGGIVAGENGVQDPHRKQGLTYLGAGIGGFLGGSVGYSLGKALKATDYRNLARAGTAAASIARPLTAEEQEIKRLDYIYGDGKGAAIYQAQRQANANLDDLKDQLRGLEAQSRRLEFNRKHPVGPDDALFALTGVGPQARMDLWNYSVDDAKSLAPYFDNKANKAIMEGVLSGDPDMQRIKQEMAKRYQFAAESMEARANGGFRLKIGEGHPRSTFSADSVIVRAAINPDDMRFHPDARQRAAYQAPGQLFTGESHSDVIRSNYTKFKEMLAAGTITQDEMIEALTGQTKKGFGFLMASGRFADYSEAEQIARGKGFTGAFNSDALDMWLRKQPHFARGGFLGEDMFGLIRKNEVMLNLSQQGNVKKAADVLLDPPDWLKQLQNPFTTPAQTGLGGSATPNVFGGKVPLLPGMQQWVNTIGSGNPFAGLGVTGAPTDENSPSLALPDFSDPLKNNLLVTVAAFGPQAASQLGGLGNGGGKSAFDTTPLFAGNKVIDKFTRDKQGNITGTKTTEQIEAEIKKDQHDLKLQQLKTQAGGQVGSLAGGYLFGKVGGVNGGYNYAGQGASVGTSIASQYGGKILTGVLGKAVTAKLGASLGSFAGPLGLVAGGLLGGAIGGLFKSRKPPQREVEYAQAERIDRNTRETVGAIENNNRLLVNLDNRLLNVPASFTVPQYRPLTAGAGLGTGGTTTNVDIASVTIQAGTTADPAELARQFTQEVRRQMGTGGTYTTPKY